MTISNQSSGIRYCSSCKNNLPCENFSIRKNGKYVSYSFGCSQSAIHVIVNKKRLYQMEES